MVKNKGILALSTVALATCGGVFVPSAWADSVLLGSCDGIENCAVITSTAELSEAAANGKTTLLVGADFELTDDIRFNQGVDTALYLENHTITTDGWSLITGSDDGFTIYGGENGKIEEVGGDYAPLYFYGGAVLESGTIEAASRAVYVSDEGSSFTMNGGELLAGEYGITADEGAVVVINDGVITADSEGSGDDTYGVAAFADSVVEVNGGTIISKNGFAISGYGAAGGEGATFVINDGRLVSESDYAIYLPQIDGTLTITGGEIIGNGGAIAANRGVIVISDGVLTSLGTAEVSGDVAQDGTRGYANAVIGISKEYGPVTLMVTGGVFTNEGDAELIADVSGLDNENAATVEITGGEFSSLPDLDTVPEGYDVYDVSPDGPYFVEEEVAIEFPNQVFMQLGDELPIDLPEIAARYATIGGADGVLTITDSAVTATGVGVGLVNFNLHNYKNPVDRTVEFVVYSVAPAASDETEDETEQAAIAEFVAANIAEMIENGESRNENIYLFPVGDKSGIEVLKEKLMAGETLETSVFTDYDYTEDEYEYAEAYDEIMGEFDKLSDGAQILMMFDGYIRLEASDGDMLGWVYQLDTPVTMATQLDDEDLEAPDGYTRSFVVIRGHESTDGTKSADTIVPTLTGNILSFENDRFSTFVVVAVDEEEEPGDEPADEPTDGPVIEPEDGESETESGEAASPDTGRVTAAGASAMTASIVTAVAVGIITSISSFIFLMQRRDN